MRVQGFLIYRIWYGNCLVYVGRTKQPLQSRIRGHLFSKPMHRTVNIEQVTKIEYAELGSEADMNLYEIYYILRLHPPLNVDDKARDDLSVTLPELEWKAFTTPLWEGWRQEIAKQDSRIDYLRKRYAEIPQEISILRGLRKTAKSRSTSSRNDSLHSKKSWPRFPRNCGIGKDQRRSIYVAAGIQSIILRRSSGSRWQ